MQEPEIRPYYAGQVSVLELQDKISTWAEATFTHTDAGVITHLIYEVVELARAAGMADHQIIQAMQAGLNKPNRFNTALVVEEGADVMILLLTLFGRCGYNAGEAVLAKHAVNLTRTWAGKPDKLGVTEHVRPDDEGTLDSAQA